MTIVLGGGTRPVLPKRSKREIKLQPVWAGVEGGPSCPTTLRKTRVPGCANVSTLDIYLALIWQPGWMTADPEVAFLKAETSAGDDVEKLECSCLAGGNVKWYSCCGEHSGSSSRT